MRRQGEREQRNGRKKESMTKGKQTSCDSKWVGVKSQRKKKVEKVLNMLLKTGCER